MRIVLMQVLAIVFLAACQASEPDAENTTAQQDNKQSAVNEASLCDNNLLQNHGFDIPEGQNFPKPWGASQHAGERVYSVDFDNGELTISKDGEQHWMLISQRVDPKSVAGHSLVFSAELKQNMHDDGWPEGLEAGGGLSVVIRGTVPDSPFSQRILLSSSLQHEPKLGVFDWTPVSFSFDVPASVTGIDLGFLHQAYGQLSVRNPALHIKPADPADCAQAQ